MMRRYDMSQYDGCRLLHDGCVGLSASSRAVRSASFDASLDSFESLTGAVDEDCDLLSYTLGGRLNLVTCNSRQLPERIDAPINGLEAAVHVVAERAHDAGGRSAGVRR